MKKLLLTIIFGIFGFASTAFALPFYQQTNGLVPAVTDKYYIGTSSPSTLEYNGIFTKDIVISGTCTGCGSGSGGSGTVSTSSIAIVGNIPYWTSAGFPSLLGNVATSTLTPSSPLGGSFTYIGSGGTLTCTTCATFAYPFTNQTYGASTSTLINFTAGASTTQITVSDKQWIGNSILPVTNGTPSLGGQFNGFSVLWLKDSGSVYDVGLQVTNTGASGSHNLTFDVGNYDPTLIFSGGAGNPTLGDWFDQNVKTTGSPTFAALKVGTLSGLLGGNSGNLYAVSTSTISFGYASTTAVSGTSLCVGTDCRTAWPTGGSSVGTVSTSSAEVKGNLSYWTSTLGYPATLGNVGTSTLTPSAPLGGSFTQIGSGGTLTCTGCITLSSLSATYPMAYDNATGIISTNVATTTIEQTYGTKQIGRIIIGTSTTAISNDWGITNTNGTFTFNIPTADTNTRGLLSAANWGTFNGKEGSLGTINGIVGSNGTTRYQVSTTSMNASITGTAGSLSAILANTLGGTGKDSSSWSGGVGVNSGTWYQAATSTKRYYSYGYSTSTAWTGSTTALVLAPYPSAGTINNVICTVSPNTATLGIDRYYGGTAANTTHLAYIPTASSTPNVFTFTTNNTPTAYASSTVVFGTPVNSPTDISCTSVISIPSP